MLRNLGRTHTQLGGSGYRPQRHRETPDEPATEGNPGCPGLLTIGGQRYHCDWPTDADGRHDGWDHANADAEAFWTDDRAPNPPKRPAVPVTFKDIGDLLEAVEHRQDTPLVEVTWKCTSCRAHFSSNPVYCPNCGHTVYELIFEAADGTLCG